MFARFIKPGVYAWCLSCCLLACNDRRGEAPQTSRLKSSDQQIKNETAASMQNNRLQRITINGAPLFVETAQTDTERQRGLMFRENLPPDQGMLFVFPAAQIQSFWMRNTFIPLDIAFISSEGAIVDIQQMKPVDESILYTSRAPALYALEVNAGWFAAHQIDLGARVNF